MGQRNLSYIPLPGEGLPVDYVDEYGGGIVDVQGCIFNRNAVDIQLLLYLLVANASIVKGNTFNGGGLLDPNYHTVNGFYSIIPEQ